MSQDSRKNYLIYRSVIRDKKRFTAYQKYRYYCKCGHSVSIPIFVDKVVCSYCGNYVFKNKKDEFIYRAKEKLKK